MPLIKNPEATNRYLESLLDQGAREFLENRPSYEEMVDETIFLLKHRLDELEIAYSAVIGRVKSLESLAAKCRRKGYLSVSRQCDDLAGVRVTCLYANDVLRISNLIKEVFVVVKAEAKQAEDIASFGYSALHYVVRLHPKISGERSRRLKPIRCEIQIRTVLQDAWAIFDHQLRYKKEAHIPHTIRRELNSLAAVLENADRQFQNAAEELTNYVRRLNHPRKTMEALLKEESNREAIFAYLRKRYPDTALEAFPEHRHVALSHLDEGKYPTIEALHRVFQKTENVIQSYKSGESLKSSLSYLALALGCVDSDFRKKTGFGPLATELMRDFRKRRRNLRSIRGAGRLTH